MISFKFHESPSADSHLNPAEELPPDDQPIDRVKRMLGLRAFIPKGKLRDVDEDKLR